MVTAASLKVPPNWADLQKKIASYLALYRLFPTQQDRKVVRDPLFQEFYIALNLLADQIVRKHGSHTSEDTAHEVVARVYAKHDITPLFELINRSGAPVRGYLYQLIKHEFIDWLRKNGDGNLNRLNLDEQAWEDLLNSLPQEPHLEQVLMRAKLAEGIDTLSESEQRLVAYRFTHDKSYAECVELSGRSLASVKRDLEDIYSKLSRWV